MKPLPLALVAAASLAVALPAAAEAHCAGQTRHVTHRTHYAAPVRRVVRRVHYAAPRRDVLVVERRVYVDRPVYVERPVVDVYGPPVRHWRHYAWPRDRWARHHWRRHHHWRDWDDGPYGW